MFELLVENVIIPKIRTELYEWHPMESDVNQRFVAVFKGLKDILSDGVYRNLLKHLIVPRLNHIFEESNGFGEEQIVKCIISWDFIYECKDENITDIFGKNIGKRMKRLCKAFKGKDKEHLRFISVFKIWKDILVNIMDAKIKTQRLWDVVMEMVIIKRLQ